MNQQSDVDLALGWFLQNLPPSKVNLIEYNPIDDGDNVQQATKAA